MNRSASSFMSLSLTVLLVLFASSPAWSVTADLNETADLKLIKLNSIDHYQALPGEEAVHLFVPMPQVLVMDDEARFRSAAEKEPHAYACPHPLRGICTLGFRDFAVAFDSTDLNEKGYDRIYFDRNGNGDLTDDGVLEALPLPEGRRISINSKGNRNQNRIKYRKFSRVDLVLNVDGTEIDYGFFLSVYSQMGDEGPKYIQAFLNAAVFRRGEILVEGKSRKAYLVDHNSNGKFDDVFDGIIPVSGFDRRLAERSGDLLYLDPGPAPTFVAGDNTGLRKGQHCVSKLLSVNSRFYEMEVSSAGDRLAIRPWSRPLGYVANPNEYFSAFVYSEAGFLRITGGGEITCPLPAGEWRVHEYTILAGLDNPDALLKKDGPVLPLDRIGGKALDYVTARCTEKSPAVMVREGETAFLPFGPPYRPVVHVTRVSPGKNGAPERIMLKLDLVGSAEEVLTALVVKGKRPDDPQFVILNGEGEEVEKGRFRFG